MTLSAPSGRLSITTTTDREVPLFEKMLSHLRPTVDDRELTPEQREKAELEAKQERIAHHFRHVRNGPVKTKPWTTGQVRRLHARDEAAQRRKVNRRYRRAWMAQQADIATLRGHLVILGVLECKHESTTFTEVQRQTSLEWVTRQYGERNDEGQLILSDQLVPDAVATARHAFLELASAQRRAEKASA